MAVQAVNIFFASGIVLEPESQGHGKIAHRAGQKWQTISGRVDGSADASYINVIEDVGSVETELERAPFAQAEAAPKGRIERDRPRAGDGIASRIAEVAGRREDERRSIK